MNILSFLTYCFIVTFTPGPTNIVILSTVHQSGTKKSTEIYLRGYDCLWFTTRSLCDAKYITCYGHS